MLANKYNKTSFLELMDWFYNESSEISDPLSIPISRKTSLLKGCQEQMQEKSLQY
jgi:hypothetical protein